MGSYHQRDLHANIGLLRNIGVNLWGYASASLYYKELAEEKVWQIASQNPRENAGVLRPWMALVLGLVLRKMCWSWQYSFFL